MPARTFSGDSRARNRAPTRLDGGRTSSSPDGGGADLQGARRTVHALRDEAARAEAPPAWAAAARWSGSAGLLGAQGGQHPAGDLVHDRAHGRVQRHRHRRAHLLRIHHRDEREPPRRFPDHPDRAGLPPWPGSAASARAAAAASAKGFTAARRAVASNGFLSVPSASTLFHLRFVQRLQHARREDHSHVPMARDSFSGTGRSRSRCGQASRCRPDTRSGSTSSRRISAESAVAHGDNLVPLIAENPLAHPLRVRAIVHQQDPAHLVVGFGRFSAAGLSLSIGFLRKTRPDEIVDRKERPHAPQCSWPSLC